MLLQAAELRLQDTDSLREHQQQELSSKLLVAEGALATMKEELGAQASRHAEELQRLEASLETVSAARQDLQHQLDTATERVQQLETELKVSPPSRCQQSDPTLTGAAQILQIHKAKVDDASKLLSDMTMKMKMALACEAEQVRVIA
jgi:DNA repair exonuclease SbcCD ATPase subunit